MMKPETLSRKLIRIESNLDKLERNKYADFTVDQIISQIDWLWKYRYIDRATMERLADRVVAYLEGDLP